MLSEVVDIDIYPTGMAVRARFELRAGSRDEPSLSVGFPQSLRGTPGYPLHELRVTVDGAPVKASLTTRTTAGMRGPHTTCGELWWVWPMSFSAGKTRSVTVQYVHVFGQPVGHEVLASYVLTTGALWSGVIGSAEISVTLFGLEEGVQLVGGLNPTDPAALRWSLVNLEPDRELGFRFVVPQPSTAQLPSHSSERVRFADRVIRLVRAHDLEGLDRAMEQARGHADAGVRSDLATLDTALFASASRNAPADPPWFTEACRQRWAGRETPPETHVRTMFTEAFVEHLPGGDALAQVCAERIRGRWLVAGSLIGLFALFGMGWKYHRSARRPAP